METLSLWMGHVLLRLRLAPHDVATAGAFRLAVHRLRSHGWARWGTLLKGLIIGGWGSGCPGATFISGSNLETIVVGLGGG